jgi:hypothetical protein
MAQGPPRGARRERRRGTRAAVREARVPKAWPRKARGACGVARRGGCTYHPDPIAACRVVRQLREARVIVPPVHLDGLQVKRKASQRGGGGRGMMQQWGAWSEARRQPPARPKATMRAEAGQPQLPCFSRGCHGCGDYSRPAGACACDAGAQPSCGRPPVGLHANPPSLPLAARSATHPQAVDEADHTNGDGEGCNAQEDEDHLRKGVGAGHVGKVAGTNLAARRPRARAAWRSRSSAGGACRGQGATAGQPTARRRAWGAPKLRRARACRPAVPAASAVCLQVSGSRQRVPGSDGGFCHSSARRDSAPGA